MNHGQSDGDNALVSMRTMEIVVAVFFLLASAAVLRDSLRIGAGWEPNIGPRAGYFPFYVGLLMGGASLVTLARAMIGKEGRDEAFVGRNAFRQVLFVLAPMAIYVLALTVIGIYVASAAYIALFMVFLGRYRWLPAIAVGCASAIALFLMFEIWFLVPLPKGPLEEFFGY